MIEHIPGAMEEVLKIGKGDMDREKSDARLFIDANMTVLDVVSRYRQTEAVFRRYDEKAGVCLCCHALFDSLREVADKYGLDLDRLLADLELAA